MDIVARAKAIILSPATEWNVIENESGDIAGLYQNYIAIVAAIPPICMLIGGWVFGIGGFRPGLFGGILSAIVTYLLSLVMVYVVAWIVDALAPTFSARKDLFSSLKLVGYSFTPGWVAGVFFLIPALGVLAILGMLYGLYLFYLGVPVLTKAPRDKSVVYTIVAVVCGVVASAIISWIVHLITRV
jgi:hypothetical protein